MKLLGICIPNYNRIPELKRLIAEITSQIRAYNLNKLVQLCISDDCSPEDPTEIIEEIIKENSDIDIKYIRKSRNMGMDHNFKDSVLMSDAKYAWIIGNDDIPCTNGIINVINFLQKHEDADFLVTPFDIYNEKGEYRSTLNPLMCDEPQKFDTREVKERQDLFNRIGHNSGIFGFLSNVVFRRGIWVTRENCFLDKMNSIFIQMYMNIDALLDGAVYYYENAKIIKNVADDDTNNSSIRIAKILIGLDGVVEYFFKGDEKKHFKEILTDAYINGTVWELPKDEELGNKCQSVTSKKNEIYRNHYVIEKSLKAFFKEKRVLIFGSGDYGKRSLEKLEHVGIEVVGVADSNQAKVGQDFCGYKIMSISEMEKYYIDNPCWIILACHFGLVDMYKTLNNMNIGDIAVIC